MMLTYRLVSDRTPRTTFKMAVARDGKVVGHILSPGVDTYFYRPKGAALKACSGPFDTLEATQEALS